MMENTIIGYQYSPKDGKYIGVYAFPNNLDQDDVHLPPFTILEAPPAPKEGFDIFRVDNKWTYQPVVEPDLDIPPIEDYGMVTQSFIDFLKSVNKWTAEDQARRDEALTRLEQEQQAIQQAMANNIAQ